MSRALTIEDLFKVERLSHIAISEDGENAWLVTKKINLEANESHTENYRVLDTGDVIKHTLAEKGGSDITFSGDGKWIFFASDKQIWMATAEGVDARPITTGVGGASMPRASFDGSFVIFTRSVYSNPEVQKAFETSGEDPELATIYGASHPKARVRIADKLMYRHWDSWTENKRNHLFIVNTSTGEMRDLTPEDADVPPIALDMGCEYDISADGRFILFVKNADRQIARSTNNSVYLMEIGEKLAPLHCERISDSDGCDFAPKFLQDGSIAYISMLTPGYEADAQRFKIFDPETGATRLYLADFERSIDSFFQTSETTILFTAQDFAHISLYQLDLESGKVMQLTSGRTYSKLAVGGGRILAGLESLSEPLDCVEIFSLEAFTPCTQMGEEFLSHEQIYRLTRFGEVLAPVDMHPGRCIHYDYKGQTLEGYIVIPPDFVETDRYPMILLIHGGPQGAFLDSFHYRWNAEMFAAKGAVVAFCNPQGSTGYGHELTRSISRHWSDDCPEAILAFVDQVLREVPSIDPKRMAAAGASFGGYMINWLMGHTDRFKAFVSHDGIFNTEMSGYITDELWFCDYEFGGAPHENPEEYQRHSPHRFVKNFHTPTLVVQGEQDFRCFISEGVALFTALQYMGVESRLVYFPTEGHWVLDPANSAVWYDEVIGWMMKYIS